MRGIPSKETMNPVRDARVIDGFVAKKASKIRVVDDMISPYHLGDPMPLLRFQAYC
jgi:hypothetical protein